MALFSASSPQTSYLAVTVPGPRSCSQQPCAIHGYSSCAHKCGDVRKPRHWPKTHVKTCGHTYTGQLASCHCVNGREHAPSPHAQWWAVQGRVCDGSFPILMPVIRFSYKYILNGWGRKSILREAKKTLLFYVESTAVWIDHEQIHGTPSY